MNKTPCTSCQTEAKFKAGEPTTSLEMNQWSLWGCFCTTEQADEANRWFESVTR